MKRIILLLFIIGVIATSAFLFYNFKENKELKEYSKTIYVKDLNPKSFIELCKKRYNKTPINSVTMAGEFPENWVKPNDVNYLISLMYSKEKCCGYMNIFSSHISKEDAEIGGFALIFLDSYISKTKINLGLNSYPKTSKESIRKIENWYRKTKKI
ncbi:hypothetical protein [Flavobacterium sp. LHD-85]|uniref:hypothetical protein n=1 Tax=Flavobacterium sp. LHD-85 TaxID=3071410 RepID=UPI0027E0B9E7|nr:hypothetical protein [Flavobacterium sp. LHD-85]MDQ6531493.1 hypothetical protein [Flavobacterium sp. LHD-85]